MFYFIFFLTDATIPHDRILQNKTGHLSECTFLIRMLFKDVY